jgi:hypothetical protein
VTDTHSGTPVPWAEFVQRSAGISEESFVAKNPHPFLLIELRGTADEVGNFQTLLSPPDADTHADDGPPVKGTGTTRVRRPGTPDPGPEGEPLERLVVGLVKANANSFASMITFGRAATNDVRINLSSVSKFHAYFMHVRASGRWLICDANSSNGTYVNREKLVGSTRRELENGDGIRFGPDVEARFFDAKSLFDMMRSSKS